MVIKHNASAMNANRMLGNVTEFTIASSVEKLSSGYRINRAADDAAGLSISEGMRRQIRGLTQAARNTQEGISLIQIAEGGLNEVTAILQRMNELAVQSANGIYQDSTERTYLEQEVRSLMEEIDRIAEDTKFNGISLLKTETEQIDGNSADATNVSTLAEVGTPMALSAMYGDTIPVSEATGDFSVTGGTYGIDYTYYNGELTVLSSEELTITTNGLETTNRIVVGEGVEQANITLSDVKIVLPSGGDTPFDTGNNHVSLTLVGTNVLSNYENSASSNPAVTVREQGTLTIEGEGTLQTITAGSGIGHALGEVGGEITILSGTIDLSLSADKISSGGGNVTVYGGDIYGGISSEGGNITIHGGNIDATSSPFGILSGDWGTTAGEITITGGSILANTTIFSSGIGAMGSGECTITMSNQIFSYTDSALLPNTDYTITMENGETYQMTSDEEGTLLIPLENYKGETVTIVDEMGNSILEGSLLSCATLRLTESAVAPLSAVQGDVMPISGATGDFTVTGGTYGTDYTYDYGVLTVLSSKALTITTNGVETTDRIVVQDGVGSATVTLKDVNIDVSEDGTYSYESAFDTGNNDVTILLVGDNVLKPAFYGAGIEVGETGSVTIDGDGTLEIETIEGAGIGSVSAGPILNPAGDIIINGGTIITITAIGAGIGSGNGGTVGDITINGGTIIAISEYGAGIGSGESGTAGDITINGGTITATSIHGAGIGSGSGENGSGRVTGDITITGGNIVAESELGEAIGKGANSTTLTQGSVSISDVYAVYTDSVLSPNTQYTVEIAGESPQTLTTNEDGELLIPLQNYTGETVRITNGNGEVIYDGSLLEDITRVELREYRIEEDSEDSNDSLTWDQFTDTIYFHVGCDSDDYIGYSIKDMCCASIGIGNVSLATQQSSRESIEQIYNAIEYVGSYRAYMGAMQNRLESTYSNLMNVVENTTNAESRIRDTDMAREMVIYSNAKILQQAGQAMLAQANKINEGVLGLL